MKRADQVKLRAGKNIAMKVPAHEYEATVRFYRDIIGLLPLEGKATATVFKFGDKHLWIDKASHLSRSEIWLQIECDDLEQAQKYFQAKGITRRDEIENLPEGFKGFWVSGPNDIIHLISEA